MRRSGIALLAALQLSNVQARSFSVHEDLLAFPQYDVEFSDDWIFDKDAQALIDSDAPKTTTSDMTRATTSDESPGNEGYEGTGKEYAVMKLASQKYLCTIPIFQSTSSENQTAANELAKAEEAKELSRATASGWGLLSDLGDRCLYFGSGWWTYRFCENRKIVQFHAAGATTPGQLPRRDPSTAEYTLGAVPAVPVSSSAHSTQKNEQTDGQDERGTDLVPAEVQEKGDQRYLVQKLEGGTTCDLTGRPRTIEVQYHCVPGLKDARISWIKEVTICAYLMVVNTPRLCDDVAFLPPKETKANPITCRSIIANDATPPNTDIKQTTQDKDAEEIFNNGNVLLKGERVVGGVVVGARNILSNADEEGKPPVKVDANTHANPLETGEILGVVAQGASKAQGGKVEVMDNAEMRKMEIDPKAVAKMKQEIQRLAGEHGWRIEVVDLPDSAREIRGYVESDDEEDGEGKNTEDQAQDEQPQEGSQERLKDEL